MADDCAGPRQSNELVVDQQKRDIRCGTEMVSFDVVASPGAPSMSDDGRQNLATRGRRLIIGVPSPLNCTAFRDTSGNIESSTCLTTSFCSRIILWLRVLKRQAYIENDDCDTQPIAGFGKDCLV